MLPWRISSNTSRVKKLLRESKVSKVEYSCKFRLYPNQQQENLIQRTFGCCRFVFNHFLADRIEQYHNTGKSDVSWSEFVRQLKYKAAWQHKALVQVNQFFPSSQLCSTCGYQNTEIKNLAVRNWICLQCGAIHDRDKNAAQNILNEGLRLLAQA